jgi:hypothetical protein
VRIPRADRAHLELADEPLIPVAAVLPVGAVLPELPVAAMRSVSLFSVRRHTCGLSYELPRARRLMVRLTMRASVAAAAVRWAAIVLVAVRVIGAIDPANTLLVIAAACGCGRRSAVRGVGGRDDARVDVRRRLVLCRAVVSGLHETCDLGTAVVEASVGAYSACMP